MGWSRTCRSISAKGNLPMERAIGYVLAVKPLIFALGFLAPVLAQGLFAAGIAAPLGLAPLAFSVLACGAWGILATIRKGRWI